MTTHRAATNAYFEGLAAWQAGKLHAADRLLRAVLDARPGHAEAMHYRGLVAQATGRRRLARRMLEAACRAQPRNAQFAFNLGNLYFQEGRHDEAIAAWMRSATADPGDDEPWRNVGLTCAEDGDLARAEDAFRRVLAITPDAYDVCRHLSAIARRRGRTEEARAWWSRAAALARDPDALARFAGSRVRSGRVAEGARVLRRAATLRPEDAALMFQLAEWLAYSGREREARAACRRTLAIAPNHAAARFLAASLCGDAPPAPPGDTITLMFDAYAGGYDAQLVDQLRYRGPACIWRAAKKALERQGRPAVGLSILDAGCGTGLAAPLLRPAARRLVGIDMSERMLARAREKGGYDRLIRGDLVAHMRTTGARYDIVFAADVFIYLGDLEPAIRAARRALLPGGLLALSVECGDVTGYRLNRTQRYAHSLHYVRDTARACGMAIRQARAATFRYEGGLPVRAAVIVLEKAGAAPA